MGYRPYGGREVLIQEDVANWYLQLEGDDTAKKAALVCALAHERRLVNDLLAALKPLCAEYRAEIDARYAPLAGYPDNARRRARDLATVCEAEAVIVKAEHGKAPGLPESQ